jgi:RNA 2',3'-cyclic 3'-phosphodiesterase
LFSWFVLQGLYFTATLAWSRPQKECGQSFLGYVPMKDKIKEAPVRVFFALWPDTEERAALAAWQPALKKLCGGKVMRAETLHATLVFLGDVVQHRLEALKLAAQEVQGRPFDLTFNAAHYWGHNHIVHAAPGMAPPQLRQLVHGLEQCLIAHHFHFDKHPAYKPHVTLLRHAKWGDAPLPKMHEVKWRMEGFSLMQSVRNEEGANYLMLARFPFR